MQRRNSKQNKSHQLSIVETGFGKRSNASPTREERIDAFIRMVIMRNLPFNFGENEEVKTAFADDDFGGLPKARQVGKAVDEKAEAVLEETKRRLKKVPTMAISADIWTNKSSRAFLNVLSHYIDENWKMNTEILGFEDMKNNRHTGVVIARYLRYVCTAMGLQGDLHIPVVVTDSASNMIKALSEWRNTMNSDASTRIPPLKRRREEELEGESDDSSSDSGRELSESESDSDSSDSDVNDSSSILDGQMLCHLACLAHILNNAIKYSLKEQLVKELVVHAKALSKGFRNGELRNALRHEQQCNREPYLAPILSNRTRWHSTYAMLHRLQRLLPAIQTAHDGLVDEDRDIPNKVTDAVNFFRESDKKSLLSNLVSILDGVQRYGRVLESSRKVVIQEVVKLVVTLRRGPLKTTEDDDSAVITFKRAVDHELDKRLKKYDLRVCAAACFLDPRFYKKSRGFSEAPIKLIQEMIAHEPPNTLIPRLFLRLWVALARQNVPLPYSISVGDLQEELKRRFCCSETGLEPLLSENESENSPMMDLEYLESEKMANRWKKVYYRSFKIST